MLRNIKQTVFVVSMIFAVSTASGQKIKTTPFGKGINFMAADSSMSMKFHFRMQQLFLVEYDASSDEWSSNALVRRARLKFGGNAFTDKLTYKVELGLSNRDMSVNKEDGQGRDASRLILDMVLKYQFAKNWQVWVGQTKLPGNRERVVSSANLQFVDRSNVNSKFNIDRDMGIQLHGKYAVGNVILQPKFAFSNGEGRDITEGNHGGHCYTARLDVLPFGAFEGKKQDYILADITRQSKPKLALGVTYNYNHDAVRQQGQLGSFVYDTTGEYALNTLASLQADMIFKYKGFSMLSEFAVTTAEKNMDYVSKLYNTGTGFNIQAGYVFPSNWEIAGRYTTVSPDNEAYSGISGQTEYTLGFSKYIVGHSLKLQTDYSILENAGVADLDYRMRFQVEMQL